MAQNDEPAFDTFIDLGRDLGMQNQTSCRQQMSLFAANMSTTAEAHKEVVRSYYAKLWNDQNFDLVSEILAADITFAGLTDLSRLQRVKVGSGREGFAAYVKTMHSFLSNYNIEVEDMVAEGNKVFCRTVVCGIHRGQFM